MICHGRLRPNLPRGVPRGANCSGAQVWAADHVSVKDHTKEFEDSNIIDQ